MEIKKKVILRSVAGEYMLMPVGDTAIQYNGIFILTESAHLLWQGITEGKEKDELVNMLTAEYEIDKGTAESDVSEFISKLSEFGIV